MLLLSIQPRASAAAIELEPAACQLAQKNFTCNGLDARTRLISGDLRQHRTLVPAGGFDLTVSNPPYFPVGTGYDAAAGLQNARGDGTCTLDDLCCAAAWATRWGGRFCLVFRPDRIAQLFVALDRAGFAPKRLRPVHHDAASAANLVLVEARRGGKPGLIWEKDLSLYTAQGQESPELRNIYHRA